VQYAGPTAALQTTWHERIVSRARGTNVLILDLHRARFDDRDAVPRIIHGCAADLPGTHVRIVLDADIQSPGKLPGVIWEQIELTGEDDEFSRLRLLSGDVDDADLVTDRPAVER
jgi:hypothetical protein